MQAIIAIGVFAHAGAISAGNNAGDAGAISAGHSGNIQNIYRRDIGVINIVEVNLK